jgi:hypothetical protein
MLIKKSLVSSRVPDPVTMVRQLKKGKINILEHLFFFLHIIYEYPVPYFSHEMNGTGNLFTVTVSKDENFTKKIQDDSL